MNLKPHHFKRVYNRFHKNGIAKTPNPGQARGPEAQKTDSNKIKLIENYYIEHPMNSLLQGQIDLNLPKSTIGRILKKITFKTL